MTKCWQNKQLTNNYYSQNLTNKWLMKHPPCFLGTNHQSMHPNILRVFPHFRFAVVTLWFREFASHYTKQVEEAQWHCFDVSKTQARPFVPTDSNMTPM